MGQAPQLLDGVFSADGRRLSERALMGVYEISKILATPDHIDKRLEGVVDLLAHLLDLQHGSVALFDASGNLKRVVGDNRFETALQCFSSSGTCNPILQIARTKTPLVLEKQAACDAPAARREGGCWHCPFSLIGVPIKNGPSLVGALTADRICDPRGTVHLDYDIRLLTIVANILGAALTPAYLSFETAARAADEAYDDHAIRIAPQRRFEPLPGVIGESPAIAELSEKIRVVAKSRSTVMLRGETGVGKEVFASALHRLSPLRSKPFIKLNCAALSESVLESELFGHERGAFTGALNQHKGRFELADGGTLFLDEIGEISASFQAKLLRVLQEGEFERVGGTRTVKVNVRMICATNRDLEADVRSGRFRADLYYRLSVVPIAIPPLRERGHDIILLANEFLRRFNEEQSVNLSFAASALDHVAALPFPGNIRELENYVYRAATLAQTDTIRASDLRATADDGGFGRAPADPHHAGNAVCAPPTVVSAEATDAGALERLSVNHIVSRADLLAALEKSGWVKAKAARLLGLTTRQVGYALQKYEIDAKKL